MKNGKKLFYGLLIVFLISFMSVYAAGKEKQNNIKFSARNVSTKILRAKDGVIYTSPNKDDYQKLEDSYNPKTGQFTYKIKSDVYSKENDSIDNTQRITKTIKFDYNGTDVEFNVCYVEKGNTKVFLPESNSGNIIIDSLKTSDKAILQYTGDLFYVDVDENIVTPILNDEYGEYDKESLKELARNYRVGECEGYPLKWGSKPHINKDGTKMVFCTNRNGLLDDGDSYSTWIKDLITGEERLLLHGKNEGVGVDFDLGCLGNNCLGWDEYDCLYFLGFGNVIKVNPMTGEIKLITTKVSYAILAGNYVVSVNGSEVKIYDIVKDSFQYITPDAYTLSFSLYCSPDERNVVFSYYSQPDSFHRDLGIIDLIKNETNYLNIPDDIIYEGLTWSDNNQILIDYYFLGDQDRKESMFIDVVAKEGE